MTRYWFKPRSYGYGATPVTWEGWALTGGMAVLVATSIFAINALLDRSNFSAWIAWAVFVAGLTFVFVRVSRQRTDGEWRWRWGQGSGGSSI